MRTKTNKKNSQPKPREEQWEGTCLVLLVGNVPGDPHKFDVVGVCCDEREFDDFHRRAQRELQDSDWWRIHDGQCCCHDGLLDIKVVESHAWAQQDMSDEEFGTINQLLLQQDNGVTLELDFRGANRRVL